MRNYLLAAVAAAALTSPAMARDKSMYVGVSKAASCSSKIPNLDYDSDGDDPKSTTRSPSTTRLVSMSTSSPAMTSVWSAPKPKSRYKRASLDEVQLDIAVRAVEQPDRAV